MQTYRAGRNPVLARAATFSERVSGLPSWAALPAGIAGGALLVALLGMYWDISLHIDNGRDPGPLANPAHYLILFGLYGVFASGCLAIALPRERPGPAAVRIQRDWYAPVGGVLIAACGGFALIGFPLDDLWHRTFGQDVTLWGPTHLMLFGGAGMTLIGQAVLLHEGMRAKRSAGDTATLPLITAFRRVGLMGGLLIGLSTFQGEFDFGVPQFRQLYHPVLIALAASIALVAVRIRGGRGAAIKATIFFLVLRGALDVSIRRGHSARRVRLAGPGRFVGHIGALDGESSPVVAHARDQSVLRVELDAQSPDAQQRCGGVGHRPPRSRPSESPSPSSPAPIPNRTTTSPGSVVIHHALSSAL